jgi:hypothetical protein
MPARLGKRGAGKENARLREESGASAFQGVAGQTSTTLNSVPLIETAAIAERKALAKLRMSISPVDGCPIGIRRGGCGAPHKIAQLRNL